MTRQAAHDAGRRWVARATAHPVLTAFAIALLARVVLATAINIRTGGSLVPDDVTYQDIAAAKAAGKTATWDQRTWFIYGSTKTFVGPVALLYSFFGPVRLLGQLVAALWGALAAGAVTKLALRGQSAGWALVAGLVVGLLPSQVLWSSLTLKDAAVWGVLAVLAIAVARALSTEGRALVGWAVAVCILLLLLSRLRDHTFMVATIAIVLSSWAGTRPALRARVGGALLIALVVPWIAGLGPAGFEFLRDAGSLEARRFNNAVGAHSALADTHVPPASSGSGAVSTPGTESTEGEAAADLKHLPRGVSAMLVEPFPWNHGTSTGLRLAQAETVVWYPVLLLAVLGILPALRRRRTYLFPLLAGGGMLLLYALTEGNLGTAYRHRGELVWVVALLAALGAEQLVARRRHRASDAGAEAPASSYTDGHIVPEAGADTRRYA